MRGVRDLLKEIRKKTQKTKLKNQTEFNFQTPMIEIIAI